MSIRIFGIRHHGPGSALRLQKALLDQNPDLILVEGPVDANDKLEALDIHAVTPPLALTVLDKSTNQSKAFYPFAEFSPEWSAISYAKSNDVVIKFIDLPASSMPNEERIAHRDPLSVLAKTSGYSDTEKWWEVHFEHIDSSLDLFEEIIHLIEGIRQDSPSKREIFMADQIRNYVQDGYINIAVICGAWHAPILKNWQNAPKSKTKINGTQPYYWIPWTYQKMTISAGYSAGIHAPLYYEHLYNFQEHAIHHWLARAGAIFREQGHLISAAQLIDTAHLSKELASLRLRAIPGIDEIWESIKSTFSYEKMGVLEYLQKELFIGQKRGHVSNDVNALPLVEDFFRRLKKFRLSKVVGDQQVRSKHLDLRKDLHFSMSHFFHQSIILELHWPKLESSEIEHIGNYNEYWDLAWNEHIEHRLVELAYLSPSIAEAAGIYAQHRLSSMNKASDIYDLLETTIKAGLTEVFTKGLKLGGEMSMASNDGLVLLKSLIQLDRLKHFGGIYEIDEVAIEHIFISLYPKVEILLPRAYESLDDEAIMELAKLLNNFQLLKIKDNDTWNRILQGYLNDDKCPAVLHGLALRLLFENEALDLTAIHDRIRFEFSGRKDLLDTASWIEGFLLPGKLAIFHKTPLLELIDNWISDLDDPTFDRVLIGLRRTFLSLNDSEKIALWSQLTNVKDKSEKSKKEFDLIKSPFAEIFRR